MRRAAARAFSLLELMVVVAIVGLLATLSVASLVEVARGYQAREDARVVHLALTTARTIAHRRNEPVLVTLHARAIEISRPDFPPPPYGFLMTVPSWTPERRIALPAAVTLVAGGGLEVETSFALCPSGEYRFIDGVGTASPTGAGGPVCPVGDLASRSGALRFASRGQAFNINLQAALASFDLKLGYAP